MNKNDRWYKWMIIALCAMIFLCAFAAIRFSSEETKQVITVVLSDSSNERWDRLRLGIKQAATDNNIEIHILSTEKFTSSEEEIKTIESSIQDSDGFIVQWQNSNQVSSILSKMIEKGPVIQINDSTEQKELGSVIIPDSSQIGKSLASEVVLHNKETIKGKRIGVVTGSLSIQMNLTCKNAFENAIEKEGAKVIWETESMDSIDETNIDILVVCDALELESLPTLKNVEVYGVGGSLTDVYKLDTGIITSLLVVNDYYTGYEAISMLAKKLNNRLFTLQDKSTAYFVINKDNLYSSENQKVLFIDRS